MKKTFVALALSLLFSSILLAQEYDDKVPVADPFIFYEDGTYYLYGTASDLGVPVWISEDLITWSVPGGLRQWLALRREDSYGDRWFWAPEVYKIGDKYYMYYSAEEHICVAVADSPMGPFIQREKKPILEEKGLDATLFIDDDGTAYIFWARFAPRGEEIWSARATDDYLSIVPGTESFCTVMDQKWEMEWPSVNEGPFVVKRNGIYYLTYSANSYECKNYGIGYATADHIGGTWTKYEKNPILQHPTDLPGVGHHAFFKDDHGRDCIVFHAHASEGSIHPRYTVIARWKIDKNGVIAIDRRSIFVPALE